MLLFDKSFASPEENLACDEALLQLAEGGECGETLRFWTSATYFAVIGYAQSAQREVHLDRCQRDGIPVRRRISGGGTVLHGPGSFCYAAILDMSRPELESVTTANQWIMQRQATALSRALGEEVRVQGYTDLAVNGLKFSGNAQRRKRRFLLFHGTLLLNFHLEKIADYLPFPSAQPEYRANRDHLNFLTNLHISEPNARTALSSEWSVAAWRDETLGNRVTEVTMECATKYARPDWNFRI